MFKVYDNPSLDKALDSFCVEVEADVSKGIPAFDIVGLHICVPGEQVNAGFTKRLTIRLPEKDKEDEVEEELSLIVDLGGKVEDVFVYHKVYGVLRADMNIKSRKDIKKYMEEINAGKSTLLMNVTSGYHYHTVIAEDEQTLDMIQDELAEKGFLAKLQDYEPVDFWK